MKRTKIKYFGLHEALWKIGANGWAFTDDVEALVQNKFGGIIFFQTQDLLKAGLNTYRNQKKKGNEAKARQYAVFFAEWMLKQLEIDE